MVALLRKNKRILGLDIGSCAIRVVELTRTSQNLIITAMGSAEINQGNTAEAIRDALRVAGVKTKRCVTAVSGRSVIIRQVPFQDVPDADLRQAIEYEADKYIPFDISEVQIDARRMPSATDRNRVLLVAVKRNLINEHLALLRSSGLSPAVVDVDVFALGNAYELYLVATGNDSARVRTLIDIGACKTTINIMDGLESCFHREIYLAGNDLTDAVAKRFGETPEDVERMKRDPGGALESIQDAMLPVLEDMAGEVKLCFDYFENQSEKSVEEVFLSGGSSLLPGVDGLFGQVLGLPVKRWDPTEGLQHDTSTTGIGSDMTIAMGLASRVRNL